MRHRDAGLRPSQGTVREEAPTTDAWTDAERAAIERFDPRPTLPRRALAYAVAWGSRAVMQGLNRVRIDGEATFTEARARQVSGRGLLTFSNHTSLFDDPMLLACFSTPEWRSLRWIAADALNFFGSPLKAAIFNAGKAVPLVRGAGVDQPGMDFLAERLRVGDWVHVFPEGGRSRERDGRVQIPFKRGLAELVHAARPVLLPFHHRGMHAVLPIGARVPRAGKQVTVRFGALIDSADWLAEQPIDAITRWAEETLLALESANDAEARCTNVPSP